MTARRAKLTHDDFRRMALALEGAIEGAHMGHADFRAHGRIFATLHEDLAHGMVKLTPDQQAGFMREHPAFVPENGAWGRQGCTRVTLADIDAETLGDALTLAWQNVAAAKQKRAHSSRSARSGQARVRGGPRTR
jgi:hypothetical protein